MDLNNIKEHYFTGLGPVYLMKIDSEPMGFVFNNPLDNIKTLASVYIEKLRCDKPHYQITTEEINNTIIIHAVSSGNFYNNYYTYKICYEEFKQFHIKSQKDNILQQLKEKVIELPNRQVKRKREEPSLKFELEFPNGDIIRESSYIEPPSSSLIPPPPPLPIFDNVKLPEIFKKKLE
jgi:hypothetical protein